MGFWSKLKKVGSIASMIPGVNAVAAPLTGLMYGVDAGRSLAKGNWKGALGNTLGAVPGLGKLGKVPGLSRLGGIPGLDRLGGIGSSIGRGISGIPGLSQLGSLGGDVAGLYNRMPGWVGDVGLASAGELLSSYGNRGGGSPSGYSGVPLNITGPTQGRLSSLSGRRFAEGGWVSPQSNGDGLLTVLGDTPSGEEVVIPADKYLAYMEEGGGKVNPPEWVSAINPDTFLSDKYLSHNFLPPPPRTRTLEDAFRGDIVNPLDEIIQPALLNDASDVVRPATTLASEYPLELLYKAALIPGAEPEPEPTWMDRYGDYVGYAGMGLGALLDALTRPDAQEFTRDYISSVRPDRGAAPRLSGLAPQLEARGGTFVESSSPLTALVAEAGLEKGPVLGAEYVGTPYAIERDLGIGRSEIPAVLNEAPVTLADLSLAAGGGVTTNSQLTMGGGAYDQGKEDVWAMQNQPGYYDAVSNNYGYGIIDPSDSGATLTPTGEMLVGGVKTGTDFTRVGTGQAMDQFRGAGAEDPADYTAPEVPTPKDPTAPEEDTKGAIDENINRAWDLRRLNATAAEQAAASGNIWGDRATQNYNRMMKDYSMAVDQNRRSNYLADLQGWGMQDASDRGWQGLGQMAAGQRGPGLGQSMSGLFGDWLENRRRRSTLDDLLNRLA
jgi:hypothetical protein